MKELKTNGFSMLSRITDRAMSIALIWFGIASLIIIIMVLFG